MVRRAGIAALAFVLVSCGGGGSSDATAAPSGTQPPAPAGEPSGVPGSYGTLREMQLDVESAFILCNPPLTVVDPPDVDGAVAQAECRRNVTLLIYEPDDVAAGAATLQANAEGSLGLIVGVNWIITCSPDGRDCEKIQEVTGGELLVSGS